MFKQFKVCLLHSRSFTPQDACTRQSHEIADGVTHISSVKEDSEISHLLSENQKLHRETFCVFRFHEKIEHFYLWLRAYFFHGYLE